MRVYVQRTIAAFDGYDIWFVLDDQITGKRQTAAFGAVTDGPARLEWQDYEEGVQVQPTLRLSGYEAQRLRDGLAEYGPTTSDGIALASDAIKVRDRLLTLVESLTTKATRS